MYYGAEVWHLPGLAMAHQKSLKYASANALKLCVTGINAFTTHTEIYNLSHNVPFQLMSNYTDTHC